MSKKKGKKKRNDNADDQLQPSKSVMDRIFENHLNKQSFNLSQQKKVVKLLDLPNYSLYDSTVIDIITDFLRYLQTIQLTPIQSEPIYYILQNTLYKISNDANCSFEAVYQYFTSSLLKRVKDTPQPTTGDDASDGKVEINAPSDLQFISNNSFHLIVDYTKDRLLSKYILYRIALFDNNPSNVQYTQFKEKFEVTDIVKFHSNDCLFKIQQFGAHSIVLNCLHSVFKIIEEKETDATDATDAETSDAEYIISKDQLCFISFVSKLENVKQDITDVATQNEINNDENVDTTNIKQANQEKKELEVVENKNNVVEDKIIKEKIVNKQSQKSLIDVIVEKKVKEQIKCIEEKYHKELNQYKNQIRQLQNANKK